MCQKKRIKVLRLELKNIKMENQNVEEKYEMPDINLNHSKEYEETNAILKRLMLDLISFSHKNFKLWEIKMEGLLGSIYLWEFFQETSINPRESR